MASLWAQNDQNQHNQAIPPGMLAPALLGATAPTLAAPTMPTVSAPPPDPAQQNIQNDQQRLEKIRWQQTHPWGTDPTYDASGNQTDPGNHPGKLGKIAHAFSTLGNIAGDIFAPATMANIPGTQMNRDVQEHGLAKRLNTEVGEESENQSRAATTAHTQEETAEAPAKAASEQALQGAQTENVQDEMSTRQAQLGNAYAHRLKAVMDAGGDPNTDAPMQHILAAMQAQTDATTKEKDVAPKSLEAKPGIYHGKPAFGNFHPDTGQFTDPQGNPMPGFEPQPQPALQAPIMVNPTNNTPFRPELGKPLPEGSTSLTQMGQGNEKEVQEKQKTVNDVKSMDSAVNLMQTLAKDNTGASDFPIIMAFVGASKPENVGKVRWAKQEQDYIEGLRSTYGDIQAWKNKISSGARLAPEQRQQMVHAVQVIQAAKAKDAGLQNYQGHWYAQGGDGQWHRQ